MADNNQQGQGMNAPVSQPQVTPQPPAQKKRSPFEEEYVVVHRRSALPVIGLAIVVVIVLFAIVYLFVIPSQMPTTTTVVSTITMQAPSTLSACQVISKPGTYTLSKDISTKSTSSPCLNLTASGIQIDCNGESILGSGPYTLTPPYSYGIYAVGVSNITVEDCGIANFSYGIYASQDKDVVAVNDNITRNYVSSVFLSGTSGSTIAHSNILNTSTPRGAVNVTAGSTDDLFSDDALKFNAYYGFVVQSSGNKFLNNSVVGSSFSFVCGVTDSYPSSNLASGNSCYNQTGCGFLSCNGVNIPANFTKLALQPTINSCGSIESPGMYSLAGNLNVRSFTDVPVSKLQSYGIPCISIAAPHVTLECNGFSISNAYIGILVKSSNVSLANCRVSNSTFGALITNDSYASLTGSNFTNDTTGIELYNATSTNVNGVVEGNGTYGIFLASTQGSVIKNFVANNNIYGVYLSKSLGNIFNTGTALNNDKYDVYATADSANATTNLMGGVTCNVTDAVWATCARHTSSVVSYSFPLNSCIDIKRGGNYSLSQSLTDSKSDCINVQADNVILNCENFTITTTPGIAGPAIYVNGRQNVTVENCRINNYATAVIVANSTDVSFSNINATQIGSLGILFSNVNGGELLRSSVSDTANESFWFDNVRNVMLAYNNASIGRLQNVGFLVQNSTQNNVSSNMGDNNYLGMYIEGVALNNTVYNNSFSGSRRSDYECDPIDSNLSSENGGVNTGATKIGCHWMAVIPAGSAALACTLNNVPQLYFLSQDYVYSAGATCFNNVQGNTTINCNGHTILATRNGTFSLTDDHDGSVVENCYLKGFSAPITVANFQGTVENDTIDVNTTGLNTTAAGINLLNATSFLVQDNKVQTPYTGIALDSAAYGIVRNNTVSGAVSFAIFNFTNGTEINGNRALPSSGVGITVSNSLSLQFSNNVFDGRTTGILCEDVAMSAQSEVDGGGNYCSLNSNCAWMTRSADCRP